MLDNLKVLAVGSMFGFLLTKAEVISVRRIHDMFFFREPDLYLIIASAVAVAALSLWLLRRLGLRTPDGKPAVIAEKPLDKGTFPGGVLFGAGWFLAGTCPGPIFAQLGAGEAMAAFTLAGALAGALAYAMVRHRLPH
jgi:uncharacterized membrane protein YedE/YeeE